jgi:arylsulfatase A-like enzyme
MTQLILFIIIAVITSFVQKPQKPNIIFILADDLGYGDLACFGSKIIKTPNLDKMAADGIKLTQFYSGSTVCAPSRCALMTGLHTGNAYIRGNGEVSLRKRDVIIPQLLKTAGYQTGLFGKWGLGDINSEGSPEKKGWDYFSGYLHHVEGHFQYPAVCWKYSPGMKQPERANIGRFEGFAGDFFTNEALQFIEKRNKNKPLFMMLSLNIPHAELQVPKESLSPYLDEKGNSIFIERAFVGSHYGGQNMPKATYAAMVSRVDKYVGQLMETLKTNGLTENTLVVFSSDNGTHIEGGRTMEDVKLMNSSGGLRGIKRDLYEGGIRVPTIVWGANLPKGIERNEPAAFWDFMPTFLEMAETKTNVVTNGISQINYWKTGQKLPQRPLYWEFYEDGFSQAVRKGNWKYIYSKKENENEKLELFNLITDPNEFQNLANIEQTNQLEIMKKIAEKMHTKSIHSLFRKEVEISEFKNSIHHY